MLSDARDEALCAGREFPGQEDDIRFRVVLWHNAAELEVEVREDLDLHCARSFDAKRRAASRVRRLFVGGLVTATEDGLSALI